MGQPNTVEKLPGGGGGGASTALDNLAAVAINAALVLATNDAFALGSATKGWADLFLASGGTIDWANGDMTIQHSTGVLTLLNGQLDLPEDGLTVGGASPYLVGITVVALEDGGTGATTASGARSALELGTIATQDADSVSISGGSIAGITDLALADGGTGASLADPNADRIMFWDDSAGAVDWLTPGTGLTITTTTIAVSMAVAADINTGTSTSVAVTPDAFAGSNFGIRIVSIPLNDTTDLTTGNGKQHFRVPNEFNGMNLVGVRFCRTGGTGVPSVQIHNITQAVDMLTTNVTIDSGETDSKDATTPAAIDTGNNDVATGDRLRIDVDDAGTNTVNSEVQLAFQLP